MHYILFSKDLVEIDTWEKKPLRPLLKKGGETYRKLIYWYLCGWEIAE